MDSLGQVSAQEHVACVDISEEILSFGLTKLHEFGKNPEPFLLGLQSFSLERSQYAGTSVYQITLDDPASVLALFDLERAPDAKSLLPLRGLTQDQLLRARKAFGFELRRYSVSVERVVRSFLSVEVMATNQFDAGDLATRKAIDQELVFIEDPEGPQYLVDDVVTSDSLQLELIPKMKMQAG